jgi:polyhydroxyalkanoate synthesis regulator phasin
MATNETIKKLLDAGVAFTQMTQTKAEEIVRDFAKLGDIRSDEMQHNVQALVEQSRKSAEQLIEVIQHEVARQLKNFGMSDVQKQAERVVTDVEAVATSAATAATKLVKKVAKQAAPPAAKKAAAKKAPAAKKAAAKKAPAKKAPSQKASAKKAPAKKAPAATKAPAKKAAKPTAKA